MRRLAVAVDSNLLLLLIVGMTDREHIERHKRLKAFSSQDFDLLTSRLAAVNEIVVTPNTLTETSNLIDHIQEPARTQIYEVFRRVVRSEGTLERLLPSDKVVERNELPRLGLADCALLDIAASGVAILTVDVHLYLAATRSGYQALNFNHLRDARF